jgi:glutathione reductase (NADPH)
MREESFDVIIVGSGTAAQTALKALASSKKRIAVVAPAPLGGTCALTGCQPKKYLAAHLEVRRNVGDLLGSGFESLPKSSWEQLLSHKNRFTANVPEGTRDMITERAELFEGHAVFASESQLRVGHALLHAERFVLATGSVPRRSGIEGSEHLRTSDDFLSQSELPESLIFIGGGPIAFEFAHVAAALGSRVTVLHHSRRLFKAFDDEAVGHFLAAAEAAGIEVVTGAPVSRIEKEKGMLRAVAEDGRRFYADSIYETIGRVPDLSVLEGGKSGVEHSEKGITVNVFMQSVSNPRVYAAGDCCATPYRLSTVADAEGHIAGKNIIAGNRKTMDYALVPVSVFSHPPLAAVGLTEAEAKVKGLAFRVSKGETAAWASSLRRGEKHGFYKLVIASDGTLLGVTLLRHSSPDTINFCALAIRMKMTANDLRAMLMAYPTATSDLRYMLG